jgi:glucokinase
MLDTLREAPGPFVLDAWFGFQPPDLLARGLRDAGAVAAEVWCEAPPEEVGRRYAARVSLRGPGHPGLDYVPELVALAGRAAPTGERPVLRVDTTRPLDLPATLAWARAALGGPDHKDVDGSEAPRPS